MFTLVTDRSRFFRVKRGQSDRDIENTLSVPARGAFVGAILSCKGEYILYVAGPVDSYKSVAEKFGVSGEELKNINGYRTVYPTCRLFIPRK